MDYTVVFKDDPIEFQKRVVELLAAGWELQGGVSVLSLRATITNTYTTPRLSLKDREEQSAPDAPLRIAEDDTE